MGTNSRKRNEIIGSAYQNLIKLVEKRAYNSFPVLFVGETGTGKELLAEYYMDKSPLKGKRKTINCSEFTSESA